MGPERSVRSGLSRRLGGSDLIGLLATVAMVGFFAVALYEAMGFDGIGQWFPLLATGAGLLVTVVALVMHLAGHPVVSRGTFERDHRSDDDTAAETGPDAGDRSIAARMARASGPVVLGWVAAFPVLTALIGVTLATTVWLPAFLLVVARAGWRTTLVAAVAAVLAVNALHSYLGLYLPASILLAG